MNSLPELLLPQRERATSKGPPTVPAPGVRSSGGHALLVGVGGPKLDATARDAAALGDLLIDPARAAFPQDQVVQLTRDQATRAGILAALDRLAERAGVEDMVLFYYSGHGWLRQVPGAVPRYFLVPHDYDAAHLDQTVIYDSDLAQRLGAVRSRKLVVLFDCCHAGGVLAHAKAAPPPPNLLQELAAGSGRVVLSSSKLGEQSWIRAGASNSVFTECLLDALSGKADGGDGYARVLGVLDYLFREVPLRASPHPQHPFVNSIQALSDNFALCYHGQQSPGAQRPQALSQDQQQGKQLKSTPPDAGQALEALCRLLPSQFEMIIFGLKVPPAQLGGTAQAQRAIALIQYLETQHGEADALCLLVESIRKLARGLLP